MSEVLRVTVVEAKGLPSHDHGGTSDPYVEVHLGNVTHKTKTIKKNLNPVWHEVFTFHPGYNLRDDSVHFLIYDWDRFSHNDLIAQVSVPLSRLLTKGTLDEWLPLVNKHCQPLHSTLHATIIYGNGIGPEEQQGQGTSSSQSQAAGISSLPPAPVITALPPAEELERELEGEALPEPAPAPAPAPAPDPDIDPSLPVYTGPTHGLSRREITEAERKFYEYDKDHSGTIDRNELKPLLRVFFGNRLSDNLMDRFASAEMQLATRKGQIDFKEFLELYANLKQALGSSAQ
jgi:hypothetical protein